MFQEYPKYLYHRRLAPNGRTFHSAKETEGLESQGWVDTPAKFPKRSELTLIELNEDFELADEQYRFWTSGGNCAPGSNKWEEVTATRQSARDALDFRLRMEELRRPKVDMIMPPVSTTPAPLLSNKPQPAAHLDQTVFISYSWDDEDHKHWVLDLATRLRTQEGIDVVLDQWHLELGARTTKFMEDAVRDSSVVLVICTEGYKRRFDARTGGAGYEGHIITGEIIGEVGKNKFIPVIRRGEWNTSIPTALQGVHGVDLRDDDQAHYQRLVGRLRGVNRIPPVSLSEQAHSLENMATGRSTEAKPQPERSEMEFSESVYWKRRGDEREGPYCPVCYDDKRKEIHLTPGASGGTFRCGLCQNGFTTKEYGSKPMRRFPRHH
jgi:hypothetical protein